MNSFVVYLNEFRIQRSWLLTQSALNWNVCFSILAADKLAELDTFLEHDSKTTLEILQTSKPHTFFE